jgi:hypothetical protein
MRTWVKRVMIGLFIFNICQFTTWSVLLYPTMKVWLHSFAYLVLMSWWANFAASIAAVGTSIIMLEQMRRDKEDNGK